MIKPQGAQAPIKENKMTIKYKYTIKTDHKVYEFKTLKKAREFAQYLQGMTIINQERV